MKSKEELEQERQTLIANKQRFNELEVYLEEDNTDLTATLFLKKPDKKCRALVGELASRNPGKAVEAAIRNTYIGGDSLDIVCNNDYALASAEEGVVKMLEVQKAVLKKN